MLSTRIPAARRAFSTTPARSLARMQLIGRLAATPEAVTTSTGRDVVRYAVGVNHGRGTDNEGVSWFRVAAFDEGPRKDLLVGLPKGTLVHVDAESRLRSYTEGEGEDARKRSELSLIQRSIEILSRPKPAES